LDDSFSFSEFFEVTNGGLNSPRICENVENGKPVSMKSRFTIGNDTKAHHYLRFDKIAYFNEELEYCHNFTTVWIQPNGSTYKTHAGSFPDYKDTNVTWNYWEYRYTQADYISINPSTPVGNWRVEVYLDSYYFNNTWVRYGPVATTTFVVGSEPVPNWTFMVYLDADNSLEPAGIDLFLNITSVDPSSQINIVVQMDRSAGWLEDGEWKDDARFGNWTKCKRFNVTEGMTPTPGNAAQNLTEVNMGDPDTLKGFINWTINNYPANYYFLSLWDHGAGFMGVCYDVTNETDSLSLPELGQALSGLPAIMDVLLLDACSMSMIEVAYQVKDCVNVLVGPEGLGYAPPPYDEYLSGLTSNSSISPSAFAREVVTDYINWCRSIDYTQIPNATMSATDLTEIASLMAAIDDFALRLREKETLHHEWISFARNLTERYSGPSAGECGYYIDLYHFAELTYQHVIDEELRNTADQVMTMFKNMVIIEEHKACPGSHGLSIFFPDEKEKYEKYRSNYEETTFAEDTPWDEFLICHLDIKTFGCVLTIQTPYHGILVDFDEESYTTDDEGKLRVFVLPDSYNVGVPILVPSPVETGPGSRGVFTEWDDHERNPLRTITVTGSTTYTVYYETQYEVTFGQSGVGTDFTETVVTIDDKGYNATNLPVSFWWDDGINHTFSFQSPLVVAPNTKRYFWNSTSGLSSLQSGPITVGKSGNVIGNYETQYYLTLATSPPGVIAPSGEGWYYNGTDASVSTDEFADITAEASRYRFNGWTTTDITEISDPNSSSTTVRIDKAKTVTANYLIQYHLLVVSPYDSPTPTSGWFDSGTAITASVTSPWPLEATDTRYVCTGWTGTGSVSTPGTNISITFTINAPSSITWNWKTQYHLTVRTDPTGIGPLPKVSPVGTWFDKDTTVNCTAQKISGRVFDHWTVDGARWEPGVNPITVTIDGSYEATAHYVGERAWWEILLDLDWLNFVIALVGLVAPVALVGFAWVRNRRKKAVIKALLNRIDEVYSKFKTKPRKCEEELRGLRNKITEDLTDSKITQENYDIMDKKIEKYMEELRKK